MTPYGLCTSAIALVFLSSLNYTATTPAHAQAINTGPNTKQKTGDGDTGFGDRAPSVIQMQGGSRIGSSSQITKKHTGDGDTGYGDRSPTLLDSQSSAAKP